MLLNGEFSKTSTRICRACKQCFNKSGSSTPLRPMDSCWILGRVVVLGKLLQLASKTNDGERHCFIVIGESIQVYMDHLEKCSEHPKVPQQFFQFDNVY